MPSLSYKGSDMGIEIERKFIVVNDSWRKAADCGERILQGYLARNRSCNVRVRCTSGGAFLTVKGERTGIARPEFEYAIPTADAEDMLRNLCATPLVEKTRYRLDYGGLEWVIDVFSGAAAGLVLAEAELTDVNQPLSFPSWAGPEVTHDLRYRNAYLAEAGWRSSVTPSTSSSLRDGQDAA